jgi:hypothetical protein
MDNVESSHYQHTFTTETNDTLLAGIVSWLNASGSAEIGVTISVKGQVFTGLMVSGLRWIDECILSCEKVEGSDAASKMKDYWTSTRKAYLPSDSQVPVEDIAYLHLISAKMVSSGATCGPISSWRFRISEIDGFTLGVISKL